MDDNEFDATLQKLGEQVSHFTNTTGSTKSSGGSSFLPKFNIKSPMVYYVAIPIFVLILLFLWKPNFVTEEVSVEGNMPERKLSFKKLLVGTVIGTTVIAILMFVYFYKNKSFPSGPATTV